MAVHCRSNGYCNRVTIKKPCDRLAIIIFILKSKTIPVHNKLDSFCTSLMLTQVSRQLVRTLAKTFQAYMLIGIYNNGDVNQVQGAISMVMLTT